MMGFKAFHSAKETIESMVNQQINGVQTQSIHGFYNCSMPVFLARE
jgi:hypothetical protein